MDSSEILNRIKSTELADVEPDTIADMFAHVLENIEDCIPEAEFRHLLLLGSAMYRNSIKGVSRELQIPEVKWTAPILDAGDMKLH